MVVWEVERVRIGEVHELERRVSIVSREEEMRMFGEEGRRDGKKER